MPRRSFAHLAYDALTIVGMGSLMIAGVCCPLMVVLNYMHHRGAFVAFLLGPLGLMAGNIAVLAALILARIAWGDPLPSGRTAVERRVALLWFPMAILIVLRSFWLAGVPGVVAEATYSLFPFLLAAGVWPHLRNRSGTGFSAPSSGH